MMDGERDRVLGQDARKPSGAPVKKDVAHQLRIDVTQHQMHAVTMALEEVYVERR